MGNASATASVIVSLAISGAGASAFADTVYDLEAECDAGCAGTSTGVLTLSDSYTPGASVNNSDFLSFSYSSSTGSFVIVPVTDPLDPNDWQFLSIIGEMPITAGTGTGHDIDVPNQLGTKDGTAIDFVEASTGFNSYSDEAWDVQLPQLLGVPIQSGESHTWTLREPALFDNGSFSGLQEQSRNNMCAAFNDNNECVNRFTIYDNFTLGVGARVTGFVWHQTEQNPGNYMGSLLTIGVGTPSDVPPLHSIQIVADRILTPIPDNDPRFNSLPNGSFEALASVSGLDIVLPPGTYWLGIHNMFPDPVLSTGGGSSQWTQTLGTNETIQGRWQGETTNCGAFPTSPDGGCLKSFPEENSAFRVVGDVAPLTVTIDIKPGSDPNCFNVNGRGVIPVAVLGDTDFDAANINVESLLFGGLEVRIRGNKGPLCSLDYANDDDYLDLVCQFDDNADYWSPGDGEATLTGELYDGTEFEGTDSICVVP